VHDRKREDLRITHPTKISGCAYAPRVMPRLDVKRGYGVARVRTIIDVTVQLSSKTQRAGDTCCMGIAALHPVHKLHQTKPK
jgi:hypothetical protein